MELGKMTEQESLQRIDEMTGKAKRNYLSKGIAAMVWGILIIIFIMPTRVQLQYNLDFGFNVWLLVFAAGITLVYFSIKEKKGRKFSGHGQQVMTYVWSSFGICIFILSFYNASVGNKQISCLYMMLYGLPALLTGGVFQFRPMIVGGIICWLLFVVSLFTSGSMDMLFVAACGLFAGLIPGFILWKRYLKHQVANV